MTAANPAKTPYPKTVELLIAEGIDPNLITIEGINAGSYLQIVLDADGNRIMNPNGSIAAVQQAWPRPGLGGRVMQTMIEDMRDRPGSWRVLGPDGTMQYPIDNVVLLRRRYDMDPTEENARAFLEAENRLSEEEFPAYLALYQKVADEPDSAKPGS
jgi:hypothetical protein